MHQRIDFAKKIETKISKLLVMTLFALFMRRKCYFL